MQGIILAGGSGKSLSNLTKGTCKAELPVANTPLIAFPLKMLANADIRDIIVVAEGSMAYSFLSSWCTEYEANNSVSIHVEKAPEDATIVDCLRLVAPMITSKNFVVVSGDVITNEDLDPIVQNHILARALGTVVLAPVRTPATPQTKPSKSKQNTALLVLDPTSSYLVHFQASAAPYAYAPKPLFAHFPSVTARNNLLDGRLYILSRQVLSLIEQKRRASCEESGKAAKAAAAAGPPEVQDLLPLLLQECNRRISPTPRLATARSTATEDSMQVGSLDSDHKGEGDEAEEDEEDGNNYEHWRADGELVGQRAARAEPMWPLRAHVVRAEKRYYQRVNSMDSYLEANKEVSAAELMHLAGLKPSKPHDNLVPASVTFGNKSTVGSGCVMGEKVVLGDKASVKRSVIGNSCTLGNGTKVVNCVLMDEVEVGEDCKLQGAIICAGAKIAANCVLIDCQVGRNVKVPVNKDARGETLT